MKPTLTICLLFFLLFCMLSGMAQNDATNPCITAAQYAAIEKRCNDNISALGIGGAQRPAGGVLFNWPLRAAAGFTDCGYYFISAHVDQDKATTSFKDYNCGTISYDGHRGTDIATGPFGFFKMDHDQVEVVAAAAGTIIDKHDGEYDRNCVGVGSNLTANYVILGHSDGSYSLYWHMKSGKVTKKTIGQTVAAGEYLGIVGSSGSASGPHLHFEVWASNVNTSYIDPFAGTCNTVSLVSKWALQKPYTEPAILKAGVFTTDYIPTACGITDTVNESRIFVTPFQGKSLSAGQAKFAAFIRNQTTGTSATFTILNPDASVYLTWTQSFASTNKLSFVQYSRKLPTTSGIYTFQATYGGITCSQNFEIRSCAENYNAWNGVTSTDWNTASNWSCGTVPNNTTNVVIYAGVSNLPVITTAAQCRTITEYSSASVKVNGGNLKVFH